MPHATSVQRRRAPKRTAEDAVQAPERAVDDRITCWQQLHVLQAPPLYQLPTELVLQVLQNLNLDDYPAVISAVLPLLRRCNIVQNMSTSRLRSLLLGHRVDSVEPLPRIPSHKFASYLPTGLHDSARDHLSPFRYPFLLPNIPFRLRGDFDKLPYELKIIIILQLDILDKISLVLACYTFSDEDIERMTHEKV